jgi:ferredoxin
MPKIIHQRKKCIGCGSCAAVCPKFFEMSKEDGLSTLKNAKKVGESFELEVEKFDCAKEAAELCPAKIIELKD